MWNDQKDILRVFNAHGVEYLIVGGHAVSQHAEPRATKDLDIFIRNDASNAERVFQALREYGVPLTGLIVDDFRSHPEITFQIGMDPVRIDLLQSIDGVDFDSRTRGGAVSSQPSQRMQSRSISSVLKI
jgi:hypothetical protein